MKKNIIYIAFIIFLIICAFGIRWLLLLEKAHSTFDDYYAFRGCVELIEKTDTYATCRLENKQTIKIVKYNNQWFLDGDLPSDAVVYNNDQYGFEFILPNSWRGYSIITDTWEGHLVDDSNSKAMTGPLISIRSPLWTDTDPRQDIPIMVFTPEEWALISQEKLAVSAAPIGPSELGENAKYVFALPARYNFAYLPGTEEVAGIIESKPLIPIDF